MRLDLQSSHYRLRRAPVHDFRNLRGDWPGPATDQSGPDRLGRGPQLRVIVGIGMAGFAVGPYASFTSAVGLFKGSDLGLVACKEATLVVSLR